MFLTIQTFIFLWAATLYKPVFKADEPNELFEFAVLWSGLVVCLFVVPRLLERSGKEWIKWNGPGALACSWGHGIARRGNAPWHILGERPAVACVLYLATVALGSDHTVTTQDDGELILFLVPEQLAQHFVGVLPTLWGRTAIGNRSPAEFNWVADKFHGSRIRMLKWHRDLHSTRLYLFAFEHLRNGVNGAPRNIVGFHGVHKALLFER